MTTKYIVNNASGQTISGDINIEGKIDNGYRTYRALLTHVTPISATTTPTKGLIVGETYKILVYEAGDDFLNVGATTNATEEQFIATGRYPTNWSNGSLLTVENPTLVVNVLENTFEDDILWQVNTEGLGSYVAYFTNGIKTFPREKTSIIATPTTPYDFASFATQPTIFSYIDSSDSLDDVVVLFTKYYDGSTLVSDNGLLWNTPIEIKSYVGFKPTVYLDDYTVSGNGTVDFYVTLASSGSSTVTEFGIVWSLSPNPTIADNKLNFGNIFGNTIGSGTYNVDFNNELGNYIYARAYAINNAGVVYHEVNQITFIPNN